MDDTDLVSALSQLVGVSKHDEIAPDWVARVTGQGECDSHSLSVNPLLGMQATLLAHGSLRDGRA